MDDSTLWQAGMTDPSNSGITERDWAFTALGDIDTARLAVKMDYFIDENGEFKESGFSFLNRQLVFAKKFGLDAVLDMHVPPGGAVQDYRPSPEAMAFWNDETLKKRFVKGWEEIARRYANDGRIAAFELMNEPSGPPDEYWKLMRRTSEAIRRHDAAHTLILQPDREWHVEPIADDDVAYSFHFYSPIGFTHQGVAWDTRFRALSGVSYPGEAEDVSGESSFYDRARLDELLSYPAAVAESLKKPVIIGEFGVSTSADEGSTAAWIADVIGLSKIKGLSGYIYWREIDKGRGEISKPGQATMAVINEGCYNSPAQFFGIRAELARRDRAFDFAAFYRNYGRDEEKLVR